MRTIWGRWKGRAGGNKARLGMRCPGKVWVWGLPCGRQGPHSSLEDMLKKLAPAPLSIPVILLTSKNDQVAGQSRPTDCPQTNNLEVTLQRSRVTDSNITALSVPTNLPPSQPIYFPIYPFLARLIRPSLCVPQSVRCSVVNLGGLLNLAVEPHLPRFFVFARQVDKRSKDMEPFPPPKPLLWPARHCFNVLVACLRI